MLDVSELLEMMRASCGEDEALRRTVGEGDVAFVLEHCDTNGDGKLHVSSGTLLSEDGKPPGAKASKSSSVSCALL